MPQFPLRPPEVPTPRSSTTDSMEMLQYTACPQDVPGTVVWEGQYFPFGDIYVQDTDPDGDGKNVYQPFRFPGQFEDAETGLYYNYFRDYDPQLGRYVEADPIGLAGGVNLFLYSGARPIVSYDHYGLVQYTGTVKYFSAGFVGGRGSATVELCGDCIDGWQKCAQFTVKGYGFTMGTLPADYTWSDIYYWDGGPSSADPDFSSFTGKGKIYSMTLAPGLTLNGELVMGSHTINLTGETSGFSQSVDVFPFFGSSKLNSFDDPNNAPYIWPQSCDSCESR